MAGTPTSVQLGATDILGGSAGGYSGTIKGGVSVFPGDSGALKLPFGIQASGTVLLYIGLALVGVLFLTSKKKGKRGKR
jgi:hypothetical protein